MNLKHVCYLLFVAKRSTRVHLSLSIMDQRNEFDADVKRCIQLLQHHAIKVVAFDMDQTAVSVHSRGRLRREKLDGYLDKATPDFLRIVPALYKHGFNLCIATHSDEAEFGILVRPETHILGKELATTLVQRYFEERMASSFFIVAYNPRVQHGGSDPENKIKRYHMREIQRHFQVEPQDILFFDDTDAVVHDCVNSCGVKTIKVDPRRGFQLSDLLDNLESNGL